MTMSLIFPQYNQILELKTQNCFLMMMIGKQETMKTVGLITDDIGDQRGFVPQFLNLSQLFCANSTNQVLWKFAAQLRRFFPAQNWVDFFFSKIGH